MSHAQDYEVTNAKITQTDKEPPAGTISIRFGQTLYDVNVYFSKTSKETAADKVRRMLLRQMKSGK